MKSRGSQNISTDINLHVKKSGVTVQYDVASGCFIKRQVGGVTIIFGAVTDNKTKRKVFSGSVVRNRIAGQFVKLGDVADVHLTKVSDAIYKANRVTAYKTLVP